MLTNEQFDRWIEELRDEGNAQTREQLCRAVGDFENPAALTGVVTKRSYCCLGLLTEKVLGVDLDTPGRAPWTGSAGPWREFGGSMDAPPALADAIGYANRSLLANMNDGGHTFSEIANYLENHREEFVDADE